ncbi:MAG: carboxylating nicotinate-nucleotide diphosphorylase [Chloroflexi bacterium]|nr:carboxylating nicotinate-nucleotide diphosphorylase [Chloroflexota bacterium]
MRERTGIPTLLEKELDCVIDQALAEDIGPGDVTSEILIPPDLMGQAFLLVKAKGVLAGGDVVKRVFLRVDPSLQVELHIADGVRIKPGDRIATISGKVVSILKAERVVLNFLQRMCGIASETSKYVARTRGLLVKVTDTRKTTPGLRMLEKYAVRIGGGHNHRAHLGDGILIKDNHLAALRALGRSMKETVADARRKGPPDLPVEVETTTVEEALAAAEAGADIVMLDNMGLDDMRRAVSLLPPNVKTEASGGVRLKNVRAVAETGVDIISVGALTHSSKALDISLELEPQMLKLI